MLTAEGARVLTVGLEVGQVAQRGVGQQRLAVVLLAVDDPRPRAVCTATTQTTISWMASDGSDRQCAHPMDLLWMASIFALPLLQS